MQHNEKYVKSVLNFGWDTVHNEHPGRLMHGTVVHINMNPHKGGFQVVTRLHIAQNKVNLWTTVDTIMDDFF